MDTASPPSSAAPAASNSDQRAACGCTKTDSDPERRVKGKGTLQMYQVSAENREGTSWVYERTGSNCDLCQVSSAKTWTDSKEI
jgi:hypothetical protein